MNTVTTPLHVSGAEQTRPFFRTDIQALRAIAVLAVVLRDLLPPVDHISAWGGRLVGGAGGKKSDEGHDDSGTGEEEKCGAALGTERNEIEWIHGRRNVTCI